MREQYPGPRAGLEGMDVNGRERRHWLVDRLPESQLATADRVLTGLVPQPVHHIVPPPVHHPPAPPIRYTRWAEDDLHSLQADRWPVLNALEHFVRHGEGDVRIIDYVNFGDGKLLRLRVGAWRVVFYRGEGGVVVRRILHYRDPAYRNRISL